MVLLKNEVKHHFAHVLKMAACTISVVVIFSVITDSVFFNSDSVFLIYVAA